MCDVLHRRYVWWTVVQIVQFVQRTIWNSLLQVNLINYLSILLFVLLDCFICVLFIVLLLVFICCAFPFVGHLAVDSVC